MELQDADFRRAAGDGDDLNKKSFMALVMKTLKEKKIKKAPSSSDVERAFTIADENGNGKVSTLKILPRMITPDSRALSSSNQRSISTNSAICGP